MKELSSTESENITGGTDNNDVIIDAINHGCSVTIIDGHVGPGSAGGVKIVCPPPPPPPPLRTQTRTRNQRQAINNSSKSIE
jgi:hypothetical protein